MRAAHPQHHLHEVHLKQPDPQQNRPRPHMGMHISCAKMDSRKVREAELAKLRYDGNRRALEMLNPSTRQKWRLVPGGETARHLWPRLVQKLERKIGYFFLKAGVQLIFSYSRGPRSKGLSTSPQNWL